MKLKPFFCYYGGKWRAAPRYPPPRFETIVEPFAGAAGYSTRYADRRVILVEKDPVVVALWRYLIAASPTEILRIPLIKALVGFWLNKGSATPKLKPSTRFLSNTRPNSHWGTVVRDLIAAQVEHIKHWKIFEASYAGVVPNANVPATWFVDPPYQRQGVFYRCSAKAIDFPHLGAWCQSLNGQVVVCEQEGADWLPFQAFITVRTTQHRQGKRATCNEVIWTQDTTSTAPLEALQ